MTKAKRGMWQRNYAKTRGKAVFIGGRIPWTLGRSVRAQAKRRGMTITAAMIEAWEGWAARI